MMRFLKSPPFSFLIVPSCLYVVLVFTYNSIVTTLPVSYWDEFLWVGRSYFLQFYVNGDFQNRIWQSLDSYDQPQLANYAYGVWLYPLYLSQRSANDAAFDYTRFLIKNGLYQIDERYMDTYADYKKQLHVIAYNGSDTGFPQDFVARHGTDSLKPINLVYNARTMNIFLLAGATLFAYFFVIQYAGEIAATLTALLLGLNSLVINTGLKAQSEALFLFTFNAALLFMGLYFTKGRRSLYLLLFSLSAGLCMSTKLNGSMWIFIFFIANGLLFLIFREKKIIYLFHSLAPALISLVIFVALNPYVYPDPVNNTKAMFDFRTKIATQYQAKAFPKDYLPDGISRVERIFENFYSPETGSAFNGVKVFSGASPAINYESYLAILFALGLIFAAQQAVNKNTLAIVFLCTFAVVLALMCYYLVLDWARYYVQLVLFFVACQSLGLILVARYSYKYTQLLVARVRNRA